MITDCNYDQGIKRNIVIEANELLDSTLIKKEVFEDIDESEYEVSKGNNAIKMEVNLIKDEILDFTEECFNNEIKSDALHSKSSKDNDINTELVTSQYIRHKSGSIHDSTPILMDQTVRTILNSEKLFRCARCFYKTPYTINLVTHIQKHHSDSTKNVPPLKRFKPKCSSYCCNPCHIDRRYSLCHPRQARLNNYAKKYHKCARCIFQTRDKKKLVAHVLRHLKSEVK